MGTRLLLTITSKVALANAKVLLENMEFRIYDYIDVVNIMLGLNKHLLFNGVGSSKNTSYLYSCI
jgi:hypothetical protein